MQVESDMGNLTHTHIQGGAKPGAKHLCRNKSRKTKTQVFGLGIPACGS